MLHQADSDPSARISRRIFNGAASGAIRTGVPVRESEDGTRLTIDLAGHSYEVQAAAVESLLRGDYDRALEACRYMAAQQSYSEKFPATAQQSTSEEKPAAEQQSASEGMSATAWQERQQDRIAAHRHGPRLVTEPENGGEPPCFVSRLAGKEGRLSNMRSQADPTTNMQRQAGSQSNLHIRSGQDPLQLPEDPGTGSVPADLALPGKRFAPAFRQPEGRKGSGSDGERRRN